VRSRLRITVAVVVVLVALGACTAGRPAVLPPPADAGPAPVYVAVGASETTGVGSDQPLRDAWPAVLFRTALPAGSTFLNMGIPGATVAQAQVEEVNQALQVRPNLVTVWLNVNDMVREVTPADYERQLDALVKALRRDGATRVLVANTPPLDRLPAFLAGRNIGALPPPEVVNQLTDAYNAAVARVVQRQGAFLVDLYALGTAARAAGTDAALVSGDGFHPSTAGHAAVAKAFADVLRASGPLAASG